MLNSAANMLHPSHHISACLIVGCFAIIDHLQCRSLQITFVRQSLSRSSMTVISCAYPWTLTEISPAESIWHTSQSAQSISNKSQHFNICAGWPSTTFTVPRGQLQRGQKAIAFILHVHVIFKAAVNLAVLVGASEHAALLLLSTELRHAETRIGRIMRQIGR